MRVQGRLLAMTASQIQPETLLADRERWVARGVSAPAIVAVSRRGRPRRGRRRRPLPRLRRRHRLPEPRPQPRRRSSRRSTRRSTPTCTSASWSPPTSPTSTSAAGSASSRRAAATDQKSCCFNSGAEAVENAVKIARAATGRPAIVAFDRGFHGRTLMTMTLTTKVKPYKKGFGPFAPEVYRAPAPYPYRGIGSDDSIAALRAALPRPRRPGDASPP